MPEVPILMPQLGESIAEATIMHRLVAPGDVVTAEQEVFEVETNKAVMGVTCVCGGTVKSIAVSEGETVPVGSVLGIIEASEEEVERSGAQTLEQVQAAGTAVPAPAPPPAGGADGPTPAPAVADDK